MAHSFNEIIPFIKKDLGTKGEKTILQLLRRSMPVFVKKGYTNLNLSSLSKALKVDRTLLVYYFGTIEDLFLLLVRFTIHKGQQHVVKALNECPPENRLVEYGKAQMEFFIIHRDFLNLWSQNLILSLYSKKSQELLDEILEVGKERVKSLLIAKDKSLTPQQALNMAIELQSRVNGPLMFYLIHQPMDIDTTKAMWEKDVEVILKNKKTFT